MAILMLVLIGLVAMVGFKINDSVNSSNDQFILGINSSETLTLTNDTYVATGQRFGYSIASMYNATQTFSANYSIIGNASGSMFKYTMHNGTSGMLAGDYVVSYYYKIPRSSYYTMQNSTGGLNQFTQNLSLVALIVIMSIVIGLLWTSFGGMLGSSGTV